MVTAFGANEKPAVEIVVSGVMPVQSLTITVDGAASGSPRASASPASIGFTPASKVGESSSPPQPTARAASAANESRFKPSKVMGPPGVTPQCVRPRPRLASVRGLLLPALAPGLAVAAAAALALLLVVA